MRHIWNLEDNGLLSTTDVTIILDILDQNCFEGLNVCKLLLSYVISIPLNTNYYDTIK
jgi:hypothetical protein